MALNSDPLVSTEWLAERLMQGGAKAVDSTWWFPFENRNARADFLAARIPGASFFDIDAVADHETDLPHMLPSPERFAEAVGALGVTDDACIVVYETDTPRSAARAWWSFRAMGARDVRVLDGGLRKWRAEGRPLESGPAVEKRTTFSPRFNPDLVLNAHQMAIRLRDGGAQVVDARPAARFAGVAPEPRPGLRPGHMPGARSLPASQLYGPDGLMLSPEALREQFLASGVDVEKPVAATCGSGITACNIALALARLGRFDASVYDGSWAEWGALADAPAVHGEPTPPWEGG